MDDKKMIEVFQNLKGLEKMVIPEDDTVKGFQNIKDNGSKQNDMMADMIKAQIEDNNRKKK